MRKRVEIKEASVSYETGVAKVLYDANKIIKYFRMDKEGYSRLSVKEAFKRKWNIIYVKKVYDESAIPC